jgi:hypothetical protein
VTHNEIVKIFAEGKQNEPFSLPLKRNQNAKRRKFDNYYEKGSGIREVKTKLGNVKLLVSDSVQPSTQGKINCWHCREKRGKEEEGMPIRMEQLKTEEEDVIEVHLRGYFCDESCMYTFAKERLIPGSPEYDFYRQVLDNAEILHRLRYPDKGAIRPAKSWELLKTNGGSLDYDMWKDSSLSFRPLPGFSFSRVSLSHLQQ